MTDDPGAEGEAKPEAEAEVEPKAEAEAEPEVQPEAEAQPELTPQSVAPPEPPGGLDVAARGAAMATAVILSFALIAFFAGTRQAEQSAQGPRTTPSESAQAADAPRIVGYGELGDTDLGPNAGWKSRLDALIEPTVDGAVPPQTALDRKRSLHARAERRAYMGAPPQIPHRVDSRSAAACLQCHEHGLRVGDAVASPMPHREFVNCLQCHAAAPPPALTQDMPESGLRSGFEGLAEPRAGARFGPGSPPVIPHPTHMRERCVACHGPHGKPGLRTTHPERVNCRQCHAPSSGFAE